ncbi:MAG: dipeptide epimerase [Sphingomonadales bacterium]|nr:dipeptide epimerase [Sphingomonadales bacterium]
MAKMTIHTEVWPYNSVFRISREARTSSSLIMVELSENGYTGRGECCPYPRYGETVESVVAQLEAARDRVENSITNNGLLEILPAGAARNALDCALLDLQSKQQKTSVASMLGLKPHFTGTTVETIVIDSPKVMKAEAEARSGFPLLKVKLDAEDIIARVKAVHGGAPNSKIIIDANEAWSLDILNSVEGELADLGVVLIEQPLKASEDACLEGYSGTIPLCADESTKSGADLTELRKRYEYLNIKLDKTGGLTAALADIKKAKQLDFKIMVGCMVGTSLAMAPAAHLAEFADFLDIDGPIFLKNDRENAMILAEGNYNFQASGLWGEG